MNYYWLISNCFFSSSVFAFLFVLHLFYLCLFCIFLFVVVLLRLCFLPYALNSSHNIYPYLCRFFLLYFIFIVLMMLFVFSLYFSVFSIFNMFLLLKVMLSCGAAIFHSSPTSNTSVKTVLIISIYPPSFFSSCFLFWHGHSSIRTSLQFSTPNSSNDFIELIWCFWGLVLCI